MHLSYAKYLMDKTRRDYDEIAEEFSATRKAMWPELANLDKYVKAGDKVLDIGCGNGKVLGFLASKIKNFSYKGIDVSEKLIKIASDNYLKAQPLTKEFKVFDGINIPYSDNSFNIVFCLATLPHLPGEEPRLKFLQSIKKTVRPGGLLVITCWNLWQPRFLKHQLKSVVNFITDKISGKRQYDWGDFYIPWHKQDGKIIDRYYHGFTLPELNSILKKAGWEVKKLGYINRHNKKNFNLFAMAKKV